MANLSKERRDRMIAKIEELKLAHNDDASIAALNEIENALREKKYGLVWEEHSETVDDMLRENIPVLVEEPGMRLCRDPEQPWNFIIEGDNLQALYLLEKTHRGKVDCIYIDPPYNTGARDWKYNNDYVDGNDQYRHSKWLSMMKSRLLVAKRLLNPRDSVLIVTIDEKEYLHLGCLLEEMFPEARIQKVSDVISAHGSWRDNIFARCDEFIYFVFLGKAEVCFSDDDMLHNKEQKTTITWHGLMRSGATGKKNARPNMYYPIFFDRDNGAYKGIGEPLIENTAPPNCFAVYPKGQNGEDLTWGASHDSFLDKMSKGYIKFGKWIKGSEKRSVYFLQSGTVEAIEKGEIPILGRDEEGSVIIGEHTKKTQPMSVWFKSSHTAGIFGSTFIKNIIGDRFSYPKSLYAVRDTVRFIVENKPNAIIVDFFAGSGTTQHAVNLLNAEDGGRRRCIMVTNNEVSEAEAKSMTEKGLKPGDPEWEALGIAKYVTWPRTVCSIEGHDINGNPLKGNYLGSDIPMADGFNANVKYFKCDWTPRKPEEYLLSNALCLHIKEMIELQTAREVDGEKVVLILSKEDYHRIFDDPAAAEKAQDVWVNENLFFNNAEMRVLRDKHFKYIPREFFSQELKEAGEYV